MQFTGVKDGMVEYLRVHIITGTFSPGQKLNEIELGNRFDISRAPLREAFRLLENEHLVMSIPRKGCYVKELSLEDCKEIFQVREMIECFAVDILRTKEITELPGVIAAMEKMDQMPIPKSTDPFEKFEYLKAILSFHVKLVESAANSWLNSCFQSIFSCLARYRATYEPSTGLSMHSTNDHERIVKLIKEQRYDEAKDLLKSHNQWAFSLLEIR